MDRSRVISKNHRTGSKPAALKDRLGVDHAIGRPAAQDARPIGLMGCRQLAALLDVVGEQRAADSATPPLGQHPAVVAVLAELVEGRVDPTALNERDRRAVDLRDGNVAGSVKLVVGIAVPRSDAGLRLAEGHAVVFQLAVDDVRDHRDVGVAGVRPQKQPFRSTTCQLGDRVQSLHRSHSFSVGSHLANPLELAGPLCVAFSAAEHPDAERDEDARHHAQDQQVAAHLRDRHAFDERLADAIEDVSRW